MISGMLQGRQQPGIEPEPISLGPHAASRLRELRLNWVTDGVARQRRTLQEHAEALIEPFVNDAWLNWFLL